MATIDANLHITMTKQLQPIIKQSFIDKNVTAMKGPPQQTGTSAMLILDRSTIM